MASSGMLHHVALVRTDALEVFSASFIRVTRIGELGTTLAVTNNRRTLRRNTFLSSVCTCLLYHIAQCPITVRLVAMLTTVMVQHLVRQPLLVQCVSNCLEISNIGLGNIGCNPLRKALPSCSVVEECRLLGCDFVFLL
jgi:hypothetical protein